MQTRTERARQGRNRS
uniref:Uncharacterized protein n=1 Tax=Arundo donax TaxID=35708 RepID=A0A0A9CH59_ARUDO